MSVNFSNQLMNDKITHLLFFGAILDYNNLPMFRMDNVNKQIVVLCFSNCDPK